MPLPLIFFRIANPTLRGLCPRTPEVYRFAHERAALPAFSLSLDGKKSDTAVPPSRDSDRRSGRSSALPYPPSEPGEYTTLCPPLPLT